MTVVDVATVCNPLVASQIILVMSPYTFAYTFVEISTPCEHLYKIEPGPSITAHVGNSWPAEQKRLPVPGSRSERVSLRKHAKYIWRPATY